MLPDTPERLEMRDQMVTGFQDGGTGTGGEGIEPIEGAMAGRAFGNAGLVVAHGRWDLDGGCRLLNIVVI